ncbi:beta-ketoacyl synthase [Daldinia vernicosa]|uniref:beta-ketoacyl synthase n=1 Tax=Daldinia vernicosa TaxID=114800 RepID=UPI0020077CBE|nr:beta-ketoacyl synthase [Daldinia vernicosa]KAI0844144.1 beta-ketoacyl synthase [Daldinia vernicosa]
MSPTSRRFSSPRTNSTTAHGHHSPSSSTRRRRCAIAIIGLSFLLPEVDSTESFWDILMSGKCVASEFPLERLCSFRHHDGGNDGTGTPQKTSFIRRDIGSSDARFFMMTSAEAAAMDTQQRILLETTNRALENAGVPIEIINGSDTSVHIGCFTTNSAPICAKDPDNLPKYAVTRIAGTAPISTDADAMIDNGSKLVEKVAASGSLSEAADILANGLAMKLVAIFSMPRESLDLNQPLHNYGVDSLIAIELRNWFIKTLKVDLAVFEILGGATAMMLGQAAAEKIRSWT